MFNNDIESFSVATVAVGNKIVEKLLWIDCYY